MLVIKQLMVTIDFHSITFPTMEVNRDQQEILQIIFFCVQHKKLIHFWWTIPLINTNTLKTTKYK